MINDNEKQVLQVLYSNQGLHLSIAKVAEIMDTEEIKVARILERLERPYDFARHCILDGLSYDDMAKNRIREKFRSDNIGYKITEKGIAYIEKEK